ncbi:beta-ketoacyl synthase N-terminal-like domain-containing protein [Nonlabens ponticola]|uniref:3-oxoacyl-ACP synthase n=1 Tax=Nonlabens ponticola TaxID=2496866 RepID=A0A3S9MVV1_9FLAO|nr:beta-ketoacyl synthase N-terminal-like domain-containing protein [Nonlabens ponticola]AZQ43264.1 3-oxoacyl-ACP synthase [Nonlabens ponticola]
MLLENPIYIHDTALVSPLGDTGFDSHQTNFAQQDDVLVGRIDDQFKQELEVLVKKHPKYRNLDRSTLLAILAARKLQITDAQTAVNIGSSRGATGIWEDAYSSFRESGTTPTQTSPLTTLGNLSSWVAQDLGTIGTAFSHSITCATASHAVLNAIAWLNAGMATSFIAGGAEAPLTDFTIKQMQALRIYSQQSAEFPCRALDQNKNQNMMILGEAAACLLLSKKPVKGGIKIIGYGTSIEKLQSATSSSAEGIGFRQSMKAAMGELPKESVDTIITHAPGTIMGDNSELAAIRAVYGDNHPRLCNNKWQLGHSLGASAAVSLVMAASMLDRGVFHSIPYLEERVINPRNTNTDPKQIMVNASGFGGNCVSILLEKSQH